MKKTLIIYAHPYKKSFNHAILMKVSEVMNKKGCQFDIIDLYKDNFNPAYSAAELALFSQGKTQDPLVKKYQKKLLQAEKIIFIFPIWWGSQPAIIKGFFDKVMKQKFAYTATKSGIKGNLDNIKEAIIITTSTSPTWYLKYFCGNFINKVFIKSMLKQIGVKSGKWINCEKVNIVSDEIRQIFLDSLEKKL